MRHNIDYAMPSLADRRRLLEDRPWGVLITAPDGCPVATHVPFLLEDDDGSGTISVVSHLGRPDERAHQLGDHMSILVVEGPSGYISPTWYEVSPAIPTWDFTAVHLTGRPELLDDEENLRVLAATVDRLERIMPEPYRLESVADHARHVARGTVGFRLRATKVEAKAKLSQDKPPAVVRRIVEALDGTGPYADQALAAEVRRANPHAWAPPPDFLT